MRGTSSSVTVLAGLFLIGCGGVNVDTDSSAPPKEFVDDYGRTWVRGDAPVQYAEPTNAPLGSRAPSPERARKQRSQLSLDELAESLRAVTLIDNYEYTLAEPDYESAEAILRGEYDDRGSVPSYGNAKPAQGDIPGLVDKVQGVFGFDNRFAARNNTEWPNSTVYLIFDAGRWPDDVHSEGCSATMIGASTMVTAAHCFYDPDRDRWRTPRGWAAGVDSRDSNAFPFGVGLGCYRVTRFGSYDDYDDYEDDFAVVEFAPSSPPCGTGFFPGNSTGWMGIWAASSSRIEDSILRLAGYPGVKCPPNATDAACFHPTIWQADAGGAAAEDIFGTDYDTVDHKVAATDGQSGGPLRLWGPGPGCNGVDCQYVIGVHSGFVSPVFSDDYNVAVRTNGRVLNLIERNSRWRRL